MEGKTGGVGAGICSVVVVVDLLPAILSLITEESIQSAKRAATPTPQMIKKRERRGLWELCRDCMVLPFSGFALRSRASRAWFTEVSAQSLSAYR